MGRAGCAEIKAGWCADPGQIEAPRTIGREDKAGVEAFPSGEDRNSSTSPGLGSLVGPALQGTWLWSCSLIPFPGWGQEPNQPNQFHMLSTEQSSVVPVQVARPPASLLPPRLFNLLFRYSQIHGSFLHASPQVLEYR